jgi:hypothetical protein
MGVLMSNNDTPRHAQGAHAGARCHDRPALNYPSSVSLKYGAGHKLAPVRLMFDMTVRLLFRGACQDPFFEEKSVVFQKNEVGPALGFRIWLVWIGCPASGPVLIEYGQAIERGVRRDQGSLGAESHPARGAEQNRGSSRNNDVSHGRAA